MTQHVRALLAAALLLVPHCGGKTDGGVGSSGPGDAVDGGGVVDSAGGVSGAGGASGVTGTGTGGAETGGGAAETGGGAAILDGGSAPSGCRSDDGCPMTPCEVDADCGHDFLVCVPRYVIVEGRPETLRLCTPRYQLPCMTAADCGPGFTCTTTGSSCPGGAEPGNCGGIGACDGHNFPCESSAECPPDWSCYSACGGFQAGAGPCSHPGPMLCYPPFAIFF